MRRRSFLKTLASAVVLGFVNCVPCWGQDDLWALRDFASRALACIEAA